MIFSAKIAFGAPLRITGRSDAFGQRLRFANLFLCLNGATECNCRGRLRAQQRASVDEQRERTLELSEKDVINVLEIVLSEYPVDRASMYLTGHSMGSGGTWYLGAKYAQYWAAIAPMSGPFVDETNYPWEGCRHSRSHSIILIYFPISADLVERMLPWYLTARIWTPKPRITECSPIRPRSGKRCTCSGLASDRQNPKTCVPEFNGCTNRYWKLRLSTSIMNRPGPITSGRPGGAI